MFLISMLDQEDAAAQVPPNQCDHVEVHGAFLLLVYNFEDLRFESYSYP